MRIRLEQLDTHLKKQILPVYFISGDEPLLMLEASDSIRQHCKAAGFDERKIFSVDRSFNWSSLSDESSTMSLFAEKKLIELKLGKSKPGTSGAKAIQHYLASPQEDQVLLIESAKLDAKTLKSKWASAIDKQGAIVQIWPIALAEMPRWLGQRASKLGLEIDQEGIALLCDRLEGNLLAAQQELEKLKLSYCGQKISADQVLSSVADSSRYDVFNLTDACLNQEAEAVVKIISHLRTEGQEATMVLWVLSKETRLITALVNAEAQGQPASSIFSKYRVIQKRQSKLQSAARRLTTRQLADILASCKQADGQIKGLEKGQSPWDTLLGIALSLSGKPLKLK